MDLKSALSQIIKGDVLDDAQSKKTYSRDASLFEITPEVITFPKDADDLKALVKFAKENKGVSLTARSAGTDMTGGPLTTSIVVEMIKYFNHIKEIGEDFAVTEPGVYYRNFEKETLKHDLLLPSYPASREICSVGGMVANNSGGEKTLVYGKTENYVEELKTVFSDGNEYEIKPLTKSELDKKMDQKDYEGEIYRKLYKLITGNQKIISDAKPKVSKNSAGYYLWNVWDGTTFNLCKLLVGSQGTLGINTEIKFKLIHPQKHSRMVIMFLKGFDRLGEIVNTVLEYAPESFESYDDNTLKLAIRFFPEIIKHFKVKNIFRLFSELLPEMLMTAKGGVPKLILMAEFTGDSQEEVDKIAQVCKDHLSQFNIESRVTTDAESEASWVVRRESFNLLRQHIRGKHTAPFIDDFVVSPEVLPEFLPKLNNILAKYPKLIYTVAGHVGNGNFHIIPLMNFHESDTPTIIRKLSEEVYDLVLEYRGSITGEHNDGLIRSPYLAKMYGQKIYKLFEEVKQIFDPDNIFNPGKKIGVRLSDVMTHLEKD